MAPWRRPFAGESVYTCLNECMPLLTVAPEVALRRRGFRRQSYGLRHAVDLHLPIYRGSEIVTTVLLPANRHAEGL